MRVWSSFSTKPILAGAFGVTVCSVLIAGVAYSDVAQTTGCQCWLVRAESTAFTQITPPSIPGANGLSEPVSVTAPPEYALSSSAGALVAFPGGVPA